MTLPLHIKRELLNLQDQIEMAERSGDHARMDAVELAVNARMDEIEKELGTTPAGPTFQSRLSAFRNGVLG